MQYKLTVDNGYGVDIVTFTTREAAEECAAKHRAEYDVTITIEEVEA